MKFDYSDIINKETCKSNKLINEGKVIISVITPFYNSKKYIEETAKCMLNQTFPYFIPPHP